MRRTVVLTSIILAGIVAGAAQQRRPEVAMADAARALIASLDEPQRAKLRFPFTSEERLNWHFVPRERQGLSLKAMNERQREAAMALLRTGLSEKGYTKAEAIRALEVILRKLEGRDIRDPELYFFTIFGEPGEGNWAWRYEGHHISQNWTIANGKPIATTPAFFGANPGHGSEGPVQGKGPLAAEEDLARALLASLTPAQLKEAILSDKAPPDIVTGNTKKTGPLESAGIAGGAMTTQQRALLINLIQEFASAQAPALAEQRLAKVRAENPAGVRFAWSGSTEKGAGHYYRIQGATFLIEYDNTQTNANHPHSVWRDFAGDFGVDVLALHYATDPHHRAP